MSKYSEKQPPDLKRAIGWMYDHIKPNSTFLDFGCATGYFGSLIKQGLGCKVYGVEISSDVKQARKVLDGVYSFDLDGEWPDEIYERKYDHLFYGDVLEHLKDPGKALEKSKKLLKRDGTIFVSVPNIAHISPRLELLQGSFEYESMGILDNTHLKYFTLHSFTQMANEAGYNIEAVDYTVNDYPREITEKILSQAGLKIQDPKLFWKLFDSIEARTSQYKFILKPASKPVSQTKLPMLPVPDKPETQRDEYLADLRTQAEVLHEHSEEQAKVIEHYVNLNKSLQEQLDSVQKPLRSIVQRVSKKVRKMGSDHHN